ncbi:MAG TPA: VWA domain-containing protein [Flavobacteriaceae bacterium]|nr:VWA domain-containing protein [Flavobacteriaceae bacterium]
MTIKLLLYTIGIAIIALLVALFQYVYKGKKNRLHLFLGFLRFLTVFAILLLLLNPQIEQSKSYTEKPNLLVAVDNSASVKHLQQDNKVKNIVQEIQSNTAINKRFNVSYYTFGETVSSMDSLTFSENESHVDYVFKELQQITKNSVSPTLLLSDGNQTFGNDYQFATQYYKQPVYSIILGDTLTHTDLKITQLNVNKYAFLKNKFPVEVVVVYNGFNPISSEFKVTQGKAVVYSETIAFSKSKTSKMVTFTLPANAVGVQPYKATITPIAEEKNTVNNSRNFAVEVINQKQRVSIVSSFVHPDIGALKKSIARNEQREVVFVTPEECIRQIDDLQLIILYQPDQSFTSLYQALNTQNKNSLTIVGSKTSIVDLNSQTDAFEIEVTRQTENYQGIVNDNYANFLTEDIGFENFPPLLSPYGDISFTGKPDVLLYKKLRSTITQQPLLATYETQGRREGILLGENIWQWRAFSYTDSNTFDLFDDFMGKLIQYLASSKQKNRLAVDYQPFYSGNRNINITAQYFNKNFEFDPRENLTLRIKNKDSSQHKEVPFVLKGTSFQVDVSGLLPGEYTFTVTTKPENLSFSGSFTVLEYNVEQQFLNADVTKLSALSANSGGKSYFVHEYNSALENLANDANYKPILKNKKETVPLIDFTYLLFIIATILAVEWFTRKYNGLI